MYLTAIAAFDAEGAAPRGTARERAALDRAVAPSG
jgi:hypothetical protein